MSKKVLLILIILAAAAAYWRLTIKNYDLIYIGMTGQDVIAKLGQPGLKTHQMGMDIWFYGMKNQQDHEGTFGADQLSFNADCAVLFGQNSDRVLQIDRASEKEWLVSVPKTASP